MATPLQIPEGFSIRAPRPEDVAAVTELVRAYDAALYGVPDTAEEDIEDDWGYPGLDLARDLWLLEGRDGGLIGYARLWLRDPARRAAMDLYVDPRHVGREATLALLTRAEARARERAAERAPKYEEERPADAPMTLGVMCPSVDPEKRSLLEREGYRRVRTFFRMEIDLKGGFQRPVVPQGIEIRPFRLGTDDRTIHATIEAAFAEHFEFSPKPFDLWWAQHARHAQFDPSLWLIAWEGARPAGERPAGGHPAGALTAYDFTDLGFVREMGALPAYRGRGLGAALLLRSFEEFHRRGRHRVVLGVDAENHTGAIRLYERVGMRVDQRHELMQKPLR